MVLFYANKINFLIVCQVDIYSNSSWCLKKEKDSVSDFPHGPVVKTLGFQGRGHRLDP